MTLLIAGVFALVAVVIALIRFRCSPLYPRFADINSDIYAYQVIGNSWAHGLIPYRDVYDVKGPFLYLLFGLFARLQPWSMAPPLVLLAGLAFASLLLAYAIARQQLPNRILAAVAAITSGLVIYLGVAGVPTSFTCEELAIPGALLLVWSVIRWLRDPDGVAAAWWVLNGIVAGALFWSKYQVVGPWLGMLIGLTVAVGRRDVPARSLGRVVGLGIAGVAIATAVILPFYASAVPDVLQAYFTAKRANLNPGHELLAEAAFAAAMLLHNTAAAVALVGALVLLVLRAIRGDSPDGWPLTIAFCVSLWASIAFVRHPNNLFVPLSFVAVLVPELLQRIRPRRAASVIGGAAAALLAVAACTVPVMQSVTSYGLLRPPIPPTCYSLPTMTRRNSPDSVASAFVAVAGGRPILSLDMLSGARSTFIARLVVPHRFAFVDPSWAIRVGADRIQARYLADRTFDYVWIHIRGVDLFQNLTAQIAAATYTSGPSQRDQAAALAREYTPVMSCNSDILLRARS